MLLLWLGIGGMLNCWKSLSTISRIIVLSDFRVCNMEQNAADAQSVRFPAPFSLQLRNPLM